MQLASHRSRVAFGKSEDERKKKRAEISAHLAASAGAQFTEDGVSEDEDDWEEKRHWEEQQLRKGAGERAAYVLLCVCMHV